MTENHEELAADLVRNVGTLLADERKLLSYFVTDNAIKSESARFKVGKHIVTVSMEEV